MMAIGDELLERRQRKAGAVVVALSMVKVGRRLDAVVVALSMVKVGRRLDAVVGLPTART